MGIPPSTGEPVDAIRAWIDRLGLVVHPEGGWYRETYRSDVVLPREALPVGYPGDRALMTSILYLLPAGMRSRWHRVRSEELWLHHCGDELRLGISVDRPRAPLRREEDATDEILLGQTERSRFQAIVPPGHWQEAETLPGEAGFALVGCVVAPGFEFEDFEMAERSVEPER